MDARAQHSDPDKVARPAQADGARQSAAVPIALAVTAATGIVFALLTWWGDFATAAIAAGGVALTLTATEAYLHGRRAPRARPDIAESAVTADPGPATTGAPSPPASATFSRHEEALRALGSYVDQLPTLFSLLQEHARNVIKDTEEASYAFVSNLNEIDGKIAELRAFIVGSQEHAVDLKAEVEKNGELIGQVKVAFENNKKLIDDLITERRSFCAMATTMQNLDEKLSVIDEVAAKIKLLSLNASIEAARAGHAGAGFAVIAQEVRDLSNLVHRTTEVLAPLIGEARGAVEAVARNQSIESRLRSELDLLNTMHAHLAAVARTDTELLSSNEELADHAERHGIEIEEAIRRALAALQFQDIVRQQLEGVIASLDDINASIRAASAAGGQSGEGEGAGIENLIDGLRERYVMSKQCAAHAMVVDADSGEIQGRQAHTGPAVELF